MEPHTLNKLFQRGFCRICQAWTEGVYKEIDNQTWYVCDECDLDYRVEE